MDVITTHMNADFDCLGAMVAAKRLYPGALMVFPGSQEKSLRDFFLKSAAYAFNFTRLKDVNLEKITRLILVDCKTARNTAYDDAEETLTVTYVFERLAKWDVPAVQIAGVGNDVTNPAGALLPEQPLERVD